MYRFLPGTAGYFCEVYIFPMSSESSTNMQPTLTPQPVHTYMSLGMGHCKVLASCPARGLRTYLIGDPNVPINIPNVVVASYRVNGAFAPYGSGSTLVYRC